MNLSTVEKIANAVLYEGYMLYPYRASAVKNQQRFNFGALYPKRWSELNGDPCVMHTECLLKGRAATSIQIKVRFLHLLAREIFDANLNKVTMMQVDETQLRTWQEAAERDVTSPQLSLGDLLHQPVQVPFSFDASNQQENITNKAGEIVGSIVRSHDEISGVLEAWAEQLAPGVFKLTTRIANRMQFDEADFCGRDRALMHTLVSAHSILNAVNGEFVSLLEPPPELRPYSMRCRNNGNWPVLVGENGERNMMLASPIILYDYPQIAPESAGDLFDSTEIDEILTLRILTLTEEEKREVRELDERGRKLLERAETLSPELLMKLHGAVRGLKPCDTPNPQAGTPAAPDPEIWDPLEAKPQRQSVQVFGKDVKKGDRVRLWPVKTADIMDMALKGRTAVVESIEEDYDGKVYLAVLVDEDPGRDLGELRQPGHRFFFTPEEVEPL